MTDPQSRVRDIDDLVAYFEAAEKPREAWRVGTEHEKVGVYADTTDRVPYEGPAGIGALLEKIAEVDDWKRVEERGRLIALEKDGASITLEPGGQIELSGAPLRTARQTCQEFSAHVELVKRVSEDFGIAWLGLGCDPFHEVSDIPRMPKARYDIMRRYLPSKGALALDMMHATATVQANLDFSDEADMVLKMRTALSVTPVVSSMFANSSLSGGKANGYISRRLAIWRDTDPDRCGLLPFAFDDDFGYRRYAEWALDVPMFFVVRGGEYREVGGITFRQLMAGRLEGVEATLKDWDTHLTTLFPEVRLKKIVEVRGADAVPRDLICALPALWKGILYDEDACAAAFARLGGAGAEARDAAHLDVARRGLKAEYAGEPVKTLAAELVEIADAGLLRIFERGETDADERHFLDPLHAQLERGLSPGEEILEKWRGEWGYSRERLIAATRY